MLKLQNEIAYFLFTVALTVFTFSRKVKLHVLSSLTKSKVWHRMHPPAKRWGGGWGGAENKYGFGCYISKSEGGTLLSRGELNSQRRLDSRGYHVFLQTCYFCGIIVINYSYHCVYCKMILENDSSILNLWCIRFFYILGDCKFI